MSIAPPHLISSRQATEFEGLSDAGGLSGLSPRHWQVKSLYGRPLPRPSRWRPQLPLQHARGVGERPSRARGSHAGRRRDTQLLPM